MGVGERNGPVVPAPLCGVVIAHVTGFFDVPLPLAPRHVNHHGDPVHHAPTGDFPRQVRLALHGARRQPGQGGLGVVGVDRGQGSAVPGVERLQQIGDLAVPDLPDNNVIRAMAQGMAHEVADRHRFGVDPPRLEADTVFPVDPEFQGVLDGNNAIVDGEQFDQGIEQRRLTRTGPARQEDIPPSEQCGPCRVQDFDGQ